MDSHRLPPNGAAEDWGEIFGDKVMAAALIDRRVHQGHIVNIRGNSYRLRQHAELARRLHQQPAAPTALEGKKKEGTATASG